MSTITVENLREQKADQWFESTEKGELIITSGGQPVAVLLPTDAKSLGSTLSALRSIRAMQAQVALQQGADANGTSGLSIEDIDAEISAARQTRRK